MQEPAVPNRAALGYVLKAEQQDLLTDNVGEKENSDCKALGLNSWRLELPLTGREPRFKERPELSPDRPHLK